jgi:3-oxoacyl-[acyl-carrier-protein] synthase-3
VADTVLVIGVETLSRIVDYTDRNTCVLFGDGAGAAVLQACETSVGVHAVDMHSDGELGEVLEVPAGISANPASDHTVAAHEHYIRMQGRSCSRSPCARWRTRRAAAPRPRAGRRTTSTCSFPHQANLRIIEGVRERLGMPADKVYVNIERYGNTSSASIRSRSTSACAPGG